VEVYRTQLELAEWNLNVTRGAIALPQGDEKALADHRNRVNAGTSELTERLEEDLRILAEALHDEHLKSAHEFEMRRRSVQAQITDMHSTTPTGQLHQSSEWRQLLAFRSELQIGALNARLQSAEMHGDEDDVCDIKRALREAEAVRDMMARN
jgi:hypothetical protein